MTGERPDRKTMIALLKADRQRLRLLLADDKMGWGIYFHPSFLCVALYRISHYLFQGGHTALARLVAHFNQLATGADIGPSAQLDEGLVILTPPGIAIFGKAGRNLTVMPCSGLGGEIGRSDDIGAGPGLPVVGDDVILEPHGGVLGPARVGNRVRVCAGVLVTRDVPDDTVAEGPRPRLLARKHPS